ncbi:MAG TPA: type 4a pilus biogenesis protein PilO, partial [Acidimicrobiia bacterium]
MRRPVLLLVVLGALVVTIGWYLLFISSSNNEIAEANDQLELAQDEELRLETQLKRLQRIQENQLLYVEALGAVEAGIPPTPQEAALLDDLAALEAEAGVVLDGVTLSLPQALEGQDYLVIPLSLVIEGQYFEVLGFVYGLEDLDRIVVIKSVTISSSEDEDGFTILRVNIG